ncbi:2,3-dimethylmalate dehydratase large subunit [Limihaloglobus sulfuriphilus]|uniref:Aconitate hydratase A n=1 Tax=Limihaloglobus sulfuriphilus TaxID=1851148 RepID=A0A1Q2MAL9_9BACT|nr:aconitate hydratase [Limihaloglobus sulfuriphilus]AQQ69731.1 2,3-dimethylmalate dehydratase large subunit [Limihaloglobus sulfuriphilus]
MSQTLTYKILEKHLVEGKLQQGEPIGIKIDQTLTQDATGTTAFLLFESMGLDRVKTERSVSYIDHNMSQFGPENHNDHLYLQTVAAKSGAYHSRAGNGICHQIHLERFGRPGATLLGSDSHTPTGGGIGMIAIGAGGMDVAVAMGGGAFYLTAPRVIGVELTGELSPWVASKDIILKLLSILSTKGNVGCVVEYFGPGVKKLSVPQRSTVTNMGAELGVTTSIFPSDEVTGKFLNAQGRPEAFEKLEADEDAQYDRVIEINLDELEPLAACPSSPDNIKPVKELEGINVNQVIIGSCTNSSFTDLMMVANVLKSYKVHPLVEFAIAPGSRQVLNMMAENGALSWIIQSGARILECGCGPCIGQGFSPANDTVSVRTFNRNFAGRTGTVGDNAYLVSPETAVAAAITGRFVDPRSLDTKYPTVELPEAFLIDDSMIEKPLTPEQAKTAEVLRGPTIVVPESPKDLPDVLDSKVLLKCGDKITTDHIMPAGMYLKYRSNVPEYAKVVFNCFNQPDEPTFAQRALELKSKGIGGVIVASESYGQGSSREHAALCPMYLGVRAVIARSIERIHKANLINFAILPVEFADGSDYDKVQADDELVIVDLRDAVKNGDSVLIHNRTRNIKFTGKLSLSQRDREILLAGGLLSYTKSKSQS